MGTIRIEEYVSIGGQGAVDGAPVANLSAMVAETTNPATSSSPETITLHPDTRFIVVISPEKHRVSVKDATAATLYTIPPVEPMYGAYAVNKDDRTLAYRTDA
jgi:DNA-binding beta-propeller fold protein YncE